jgi:hypothetical protein
VQTERAEDSQNLIELDGWLTALQGINETFGNAREICELALAQTQVAPPSL